MDFGKWIFVSFILFAGFIGVLVFLCLRQDVSQVSANYYADSMKHSEKMEAVQNTNQLDDSPHIRFANDTLYVVFSAFNQLDSGQLRVFCPSDASLDQVFRLVPSSSSSCAFPINKWRRGLYRVSMNWTMHRESFYTEQVLNF